MTKNKEMPKKRNPYASSLRTNGLFKSKIEPTGHEKAEKKDSYSRNAKHKNKSMVDETFQVGDKIKYSGKEGMVKKPNGPLDTIGITIDGEYSLIPEDQLDLIMETISKMIALSK